MIREYRNRRAGFLVLISNHENDPVKALEIYRCKETAELSFDDMKNNQDFNRLRVATEQAMDGRAFIQFVALCISLELKHVIYSNDDLKNRTEREIIDEMKLLRATKIEGRHNPIRTELTKLHKLVLKAFLIPEYADIEMPAADEPQIGPDD
jgi:transposase